MSTTYQELLAQRAALEAQAAALNRQLEEARQAQRAAVIQQIKTLLAEHGMTVADLASLGGGSGAGRSARGQGGHPSAGKKVAAKYRSAETGETWSGRGLKPKWVQAALAAGRTLQDLAV